MPLKSGSSKSTIQANIKELIASGKEPDVAAAIAYKEAGLSKDEYDDMFATDSTQRMEDINGFWEIKGNPISKAGVFPYTGKQIGMEPADKIFMVYRPAEELSSVDCMESFKLVPIVDEHTMLGDDNGMTPAEKKGVHGVTGEEIYFKDNTLYANLKIFSGALKDTIDTIKKDISLGYRCTYEYVSGIFDGVAYDAIQRNLRGNHVAIVHEGRMGPDVAVLDHMKFTVDSKEFTNMAKQKLAEKIKVAEDQLNAVKEQMKSATDESGLADLAGKIDTIMTLLNELKDMEAKEAEKAEDDESEGEGEKKEESKEAADEEGEKKDDEEKKGMDKSVEQKGMDEAAVSKIAEDRARDIVKGLAGKVQLAEQVSKHIGSFAHDSMLTEQEVAEFAAKELKLDAPKGQELTAVKTFLKIAPAPKPFVKIGTGADSKAKPSKIDAFLKGGK